MKPEIKSERKDVTIHKAVFYEADLHALVAKVVGQETGVPHLAPWVTIHVYSSTHQEGSLGVGKPCVHIELTIDHSREPQVDP